MRTCKPVEGISPVDPASTLRLNEGCLTEGGRDEHQTNRRTISAKTVLVQGEGKRKKKKKLGIRPTFQDKDNSALTENELAILGTQYERRPTMASEPEIIHTPFGVS